MDFTPQNLSNRPSTISAKFLVMAIGIIGLSFPIVLIMGAAIFDDCSFIQSSISAYYHTVMRNYFVGALTAIALCMFAYNGYSNMDKITAKLAGIFTLGVAFLPTSVDASFRNCLPDSIDMGMLGTLHVISAALLFITLAFFNLFIFTHLPPGYSPDGQKKTMLRVYRLCGYIILGSIVAIGVYLLFFDDNPAIARMSPVYWLETLALIAFSSSWIVKAIDIPSELN